MQNGQETEKVMEQLRCPLCGCTFSRAESAGGCGSCPSFMKCNMIRCPNCGTDFLPPETATVKLVKSLVNKIRRKGEHD